MWGFLSLFFGGLFKGPLGRILDTIDHRMDAGVQRDQIKAKAVSDFTQAQVAVVNGKGWLFPLFFIVPVGLHFSAVCVYSVFWCRGCAFPAQWSIAALPAPFDQWEGAIVLSYFVGATGMGIMSRWSK